MAEQRWNILRDTCNFPSVIVSIVADYILPDNILELIELNDYAQVKQRMDNFGEGRWALANVGIACACIYDRRDIIKLMLTYGASTGYVRHWATKNGRRELIAIFDAHI